MNGHPRSRGRAISAAAGRALWARGRRGFGGGSRCVQGGANPTAATATGVCGHGEEAVLESMGTGRSGSAAGDLLEVAVRWRRGGPGATAEAMSRCEVEGRSRCDAKAGEVAARCQGKGREGWPRGRRGERPDDEKKTYRRSRAVRGGNYDNISSFLAVGFGYEQKWICPYPPPVAGLV
jgi:hypothetical protein